MNTKLKNIAIVTLSIIVVWLLIVSCTRKAEAVDEQADALVKEIDYLKMLYEMEEKAQKDYEAKQAQCTKDLDELHSKWIYARAEQEIAKQKINELTGLSGFLQQSQLQ